MEFWQSFCDLSTISKPIFSTIVITIILSIFFIILSFRIKKIDYLKPTPKWLVPFVMLVELFNNFIKQNIGKRWRFYAPWFMALAIFIFFANI